ncbi:hypothetical protein CBER1_04543 [Cercospora berteroae]|uniref:Uncharacterized protein n=1 Tax=Cercospora berteroae TaxID=357750 RepID=A0A2S6C239_9PEZI|nr:hypothetical protein CBER1_04543 [Cercospora berteroae]
MLDNAKAKELLVAQPPPFMGTEEAQRPWNLIPIRYNEHGRLLPHPFQETSIHRALKDRPLMRLWDNNSGSKPEYDGSMLARDNELRLDTFRARKESLAHHADYSDWSQGTPFISFSSTWEAVERNAWFRAAHDRGPQFLTVTNPNVRLINGLPIVDIYAEMQHYRVEDPYRMEYHYYKDGYLCLWEVTPEEVVGRWKWDDLSQYINWYEDIIMPAYREHERKFFSRISQPTPLTLFSGYCEVRPIGEVATLLQ